MTNTEDGNNKNLICDRTKFQYIFLILTGSILCINTKIRVYNYFNILKLKQLFQFYFRELEKMKKKKIIYLSKVYFFFNTTEYCWYFNNANNTEKFWKRKKLKIYQQQKRKNIRTVKSEMLLFFLANVCWCHKPEFELFGEKTGSEKNFECKTRAAPRRGIVEESTATLDVRGKVQNRGYP